jgi:predicted enzyme related to lactoylglutathione lyase
VVAPGTGELALTDLHGRFVWYELLTTDIAAAKAFYSSVLGWSEQDASTPEFAYTLFTSGKIPVSGLMELPEEARRMGAMSRWVGYVGVDDIDAAADRFKRLGGAVYVPPTDSNIGRISVVADPQTATLALVNGLKAVQPERAELDELGRVGWHELLAADWKNAFAFYNDLFGWRKMDAESGSTDKYQLFSSGGQMIGGMFTKRPQEPIPFWLYYFNVEDLDAAIARVTNGGGQVFEGPLELPDSSWVARCRDPQGTAFAIQGKRSPDAVKQLGWSTEWGRFSSRGRLLVNKPTGKSRNPDSEK